MTDLHALVHAAVAAWGPFAVAAAIVGCAVLACALLVTGRGARRFSARSRYTLLAIALVVPVGGALVAPTQVGGWAGSLAALPDAGEPAGGETVDATLAYAPVAGGGAIDAPCILIAVWAIAFLLTLFARSGERALWRRVVRRSAPFEDARVEAIFRSAWGGRGAPPPLRASRDCDEPMVVGLARPLILLPPGYGAAMDDAELETVAVHELEHVRRRDNAGAALVDLFASLFWFDPLHWIARRRLLALREGACDERVLERGLPARAYLSALAKTSHAAVESPAVACMSGFRIRERMDSIMTYANRSSRWIPESLVRTAAIATLALAAIAIAGFAPAAADGPTAPGQHRLSIFMAPTGNNQILIRAEVRTPDGALVSAPKVMANAGSPVEFSTSSEGRTYRVSVTPAADGSGFAKLEVLDGKDLVDTVVKSVEAPKMKRRFPAEPIDLHLEGADIRDLARTMSELTGKQVLLAPSVEGKVSIDVDDVPWDQALAMAIAPLGLRMGFSEEGILIGPADHATMRTPLPPPPPGFERVGGDVKAPEVVTRVNPAYPEEARKQRAGGFVVLEAMIDENGLVTNVQPLEELPYGLTEAAVDAVRQWTFKPALKNGKPVPVLFNLTINFKLDGKKKEEAKQ